MPLCSRDHDSCRDRKKEFTHCYDQIIDCLPCECHTVDSGLIGLGRVARA